MRAGGADVPAVLSAGARGAHGAGEERVMQVVIWMLVILLGISQAWGWWCCLEWQRVAKQNRRLLGALDACRSARVREG